MFDEFRNITGFDLEDYFRRFVDFVNNRSQNIIDYYSGLLDNLDRDSFGEFKALLEESSFVLNLFDLNSERFQTVNFWELMEFADDIRIRLETIENFSRFARSSVRKESFTNDIVVEVSTRDNETLEELVSRLGSIDRDTDWMDVAISNSLEQEDYTTQNGGVVLNVTFKNNSRFFIQGVVDNPEGDKIKGLDIDKKIQFVDNDLKILSYDETLIQSLNILINLRKNDNPEFPQYGIDPSLIVGMNVKSVALPSVVRQLYQTFSTDDIVQSLQISDTNFGSEEIRMSVNIKVRSGEEQKLTLNL